jgi:hypothetical protein
MPTLQSRPGLTIEEAIDDVFEQDAKGNPDAMKAFVDRLHESQRYAATSMYRRTFLVLLLWLAGYLIATGVISEAEMAGLHANGDHLASLLPVFPIAIGFVAYELVCAVQARDVTRAALGRCYWHALPTAWSHDLERLLDPHTYLDVEAVYDVAIESENALQKVMANVLRMLVAIIASVGPAIAIGHLTYLGWRTAHTIGNVLLGASALLGVLFWLRAMFLVTLKWKGPSRLRVKP